MVAVLDRDREEPLAWTRRAGELVAAAGLDDFAVMAQFVAIIAFLSLADWAFSRFSTHR